MTDRLAHKLGLQRGRHVVQAEVLEGRRAR
jgi:hypothetical protein